MRAHQICWIAFSFAALAVFPANEARCQVPTGYFTNVINLGPNVNSPDVDSAPNISSDGLTLYFTSTRPEGAGTFDLYQATRATVNDAFGDVMNLGPDINGLDWEIAPTISSDGLKLYFGSNRPEGAGDHDLYQATRATVNDPFGNVMNLGAINTSFDDRPGDISENGLTLYFHSDRPGGVFGFDLYMATRENLSDPFANVTSLGDEINNGFANEFGASVSSNGLIMFFSDFFEPPFRPGGEGNGDIWVAMRTSTPNASEPSTHISTWHSKSWRFVGRFPLR